jgi:hypothetical protein
MFRKRERDLGVPDAVGRLVLAELVRDAADVLRAPQAPKAGDPFGDEVREVAKLVSAVAEPFGQLDAVATRELDDRRRPHGALEVYMEMHLWERHEVAHRAMVSASTPIYRVSERTRSGGTCRRFRGTTGRFSFIDGVGHRNPV